MSDELELKVCAHTTPDIEPHPCPFQADVHDDPVFRCRCCEDCRMECLWEI